ncbi:MAG: hypothetical protein KGJ21_08020, partial [Pseudomonadota bacterium]|nr:hypothetical protein [Pseudomonadota bacterium]
EIYAAINEDKGGIYKQLKGAQDVILRADAALAAEKSPKVSNPGVTHDSRAPDPKATESRPRVATSQPSTVVSRDASPPR